MPPPPTVSAPMPKGRLPKLSALPAQRRQKRRKPTHSAAWRKQTPPLPSSETADANVRANNANVRAAVAESVAAQTPAPAQVETTVTTETKPVARASTAKKTVKTKVVRKAPARKAPTVASAEHTSTTSDADGHPLRLGRRRISLAFDRDVDPCRMSCGCRRIGRKGGPSAA